MNRISMTGYIFEHEGRQYTPDGVVQVTSEHNAQLEQAELAYWATKPDHFVAYVVHGQITTWLGTKLGEIIAASRFTNNLTGSRMEHVRVNSSNGERYHGTYGCDWASAVRLRRCKSQ